MIASAECFSPRVDHVLAAATAVEMIHTYSLIHDDLPAMDNDDLRRGLPSNHKQFDEATAILAGDALMTYAYELIVRFTDRSKVDAATILTVIQELGQTTGIFGMVGGQMMDLYYEKHQAEAAESVVKEIHQRKTGALIRASIRIGAMLMGASQYQLDQLNCFANHLGLAFQIVDDILDLTGTTSELGKNPGSDLAKQKLTYPAVFGLEKSKSLAEEEKDLALEALSQLNADVHVLRELTEFIVNRKN